MDKTEVGGEAVQKQTTKRSLGVCWAFWYGSVQFGREFAWGVWGDAAVGATDIGFQTLSQIRKAVKSKAPKSYGS